jgi:hypothetical protein
LRLGEGRHIQIDHDRRHRAEPPARGRTRDAEIRGNGYVAGAADEIPQPVIIALLRSRRGRHGLNSSKTMRAVACLSWTNRVTTTRPRRCRMSLRIAALVAAALLAVGIFCRGEVTSLIPVEPMENYSERWASPPDRSTALAIASGAG